MAATGGVLITSGKNSAFPRFPGGASRPRFSSFFGWPRPYGAPAGLADTKILSQPIIDAMDGVDRFYIVHPFKIINLKATSREIKNRKTGKPEYIYYQFSSN